MNKKERYAKYKAEGKCPLCLKPTDGLAYCSKCREKITAKRRAIEKRCIDCNTLMPYTGKFRGKRCKECGDKRDKVIVNNWYKNLDPERKAKKRQQMTEYARRWRKKNPEKYASKHLKRAYGITFFDLKEMHEKQNGKCAICLSELPTDLLNSNARKGMHVDHSHDTNKVRGLLCTKCNLGIGLFSDSVEILRSAIAYLESYRK